VVKLLLERGDVDPNHPNVNGLIPLVSARGGEHEGVVKLLLVREDAGPDRGDKIDRIPPEHASTLDVPLKRKRSINGEEEEETAKRARGGGNGS